MCQLPCLNCKGRSVAVLEASDALGVSNSVSSLYAMRPLEGAWPRVQLAEGEGELLCRQFTHSKSSAVTFVSMKLAVDMSVVRAASLFVRVTGRRDAFVRCAKGRGD